MLVVAVSAVFAVAQIGSPHQLSDLGKVLLGTLVALEGVFVNLIVDTGLGDAHAVFFIRQIHAVFRVGQNFQHRFHAHLAGRDVAKLFFKLLAIHPFLDERTGGAINTRHIREVNAVGRVLRAERAITHGIDGAGALRATAQPHVLVCIKSKRGAGVVHQVTTHLVMLVGQTILELVALGQQQQTW